MELLSYNKTSQRLHSLCFRSAEIANGKNVNNPLSVFIDGYILREYLHSEEPYLVLSTIQMCLFAKHLCTLVIFFFPLCPLQCAASVSLAVAALPSFLNKPPHHMGEKNALKTRRFEKEKKIPCPFPPRCHLQNFAFFFFYTNFCFTSDVGQGSYLNVTLPKTSSSHFVQRETEGFVLFYLVGHYPEGGFFLLGD